MQPAVMVLWPRKKNVMMAMTLLVMAAIQHVKSSLATGVVGASQVSAYCVNVN